MTDHLLFQAPGVTIIETDESTTTIPYRSEIHEDGDRNHGWVDLVDHPERVADIPEAQKSPGMADLLRALAEPGPFVTSGCECGLFEAPAKTGYRLYVGGYIDVMFRNGDFNTPERLYQALESWLACVPPPVSPAMYTFQFLIQPLRSFFGRHGCFSVMMKPIGWGQTPEEAWGAYDAACRALTAGYVDARAGLGAMFPTKMSLSDESSG